MELLTSLHKIEETFQNIFHKLRKTVQNNLFFTIISLLLAQNCQLPQITRQMCKINGNNFHANENKLARFLNSSAFHVDDTCWRAHIKMVFNLLEEGNHFHGFKYIPIIIDFTSHTDKFLILSGAIPFAGRAIPLYFSLRNYPKTSGKLNQVKMEQAFLKALHSMLPKGFKYLILADRGFGNARFMKDCLDNGFDYLVRTQENWHITINDEKIKLKELHGRCDFKKVEISEQETRMVSNFLGKSSKWYLFTSLKEVEWSDLIAAYKSRFQIEKLFQDEKNSGFEIEKSKIEKYMRFKRLLFCVYVAQALMMFIGEWINDNCDEIKKKYPLHINIISAFSK